MGNCSSANLSMADWGHVIKLVGNQFKTNKKGTLYCKNLLLQELWEPIMSAGSKSS